MEHVVLLSSGSALLPWAVRGNAIAREHHEVEVAPADSGVPSTAVRPLVPAGNALY